MSTNKTESYAQPYQWVLEEIQIWIRSKGFCLIDFIVIRHCFGRQYATML